MPRRVLLLAYMFPPIVDGGGFRPFSFARYLPEFGYEPIVLTRPDSGGLPLDASQLDKLPSCVRVERVAAGFADGWNDRFRQGLAWLRPVEVLFNRPAGTIAEGVAWRVARRDPLRQWEATWMHPAVDSGMRLIARHQPDVILATAPPFETLKAGSVLSRQTGVPLVADFRDPWTYGNLWNPTSGRRARRERVWEQRVVGDAAKILVVTPSMHRAMAETYRDRAADVKVVMNGYEDLAGGGSAPSPDRFVLRYVGAIMDRRLPPALFEAFRRLRDRHPQAAGDIRLQLVGPNHCSYSLEERFRREDLPNMAEWLGPMSPDQAREQMRSAHVLLHIESTAHYAISGKVFEYLAAKRPILGLLPPGSDDEWFLLQSGAGSNAGLDDPDRLAAAIHERWTDWRAGRLGVTTNDTWLGQFHRREQTRKLAALLDEVIGPAGRSR